MGGFSVTSLYLFLSPLRYAVDAHRSPLANCSAPRCSIHYQYICCIYAQYVRARARERVRVCGVESVSVCMHDRRTCGTYAHSSTDTAVQFSFRRSSRRRARVFLLSFRGFRSALELARATALSLPSPRSVSTIAFARRCFFFVCCCRGPRAAGGFFLSACDRAQTHNFAYRVFLALTF